ncbi:hypothetical protein I4F81_005522 [Pyropia yezoensis]|uniref:Uncharacterized protein n=1 Tax=Pyropia yezoensis TaxID=2788 RepID=A0ACC3BZP2_PYRYE|nr:hypothetical protein I4F81_005522 [Neopyropia yezoensis]
MAPAFAVAPPPRRGLLRPGGAGGAGLCAPAPPARQAVAEGAVGLAVGRRRRSRRRCCPSDAGPRMGGDDGGGESVEARRARFKVTTLREDPLTRRVPGPKKFSKAASAQQNLSFQDAWAAKNGGVVVDVWFIVGLLFILTPFLFLGWAFTTGVIPGVV